MPPFCTFARPACTGFSQLLHVITLAPHFRQASKCVFLTYDYPVYHAFSCMTTNIRHDETYWYDTIHTCCHFQKYYCLPCLPPVMAFIKIELAMASFCNTIAIFSYRRL